MTKEPELRTKLPENPDPQRVHARSPFRAPTAQTDVDDLMALRAINPEAAERKARQMWRNRCSDD